MIADDLHRKVRNLRRDHRPGSARTAHAYRYAAHLVEQLRDRLAGKAPA